MIKHSKNPASSQSRNYWIALIIAISALHSMNAFAVTLGCTLPYTPGPFGAWPQQTPSYDISARNGWTMTPDTYYRKDENGIEYTISRHTGVLTKVGDQSIGGLPRTGSCDLSGDEKPKS